MLKIKELDIVRLKDGREVTILEVFKSGEAFMAEEVAPDGRTITTPVIKNDDVLEVTYSA